MSPRVEERPRGAQPGFRIESRLEWEGHPGEWSEITGRNRFRSQVAAERRIRRYLWVWRMGHKIMGPPLLGARISYRVVPDDDAFSS